MTTFAPRAICDYRLLFLGGVAGQATAPLEFVAQIVWVQQNAPEHLRIVLVGTIAAARGGGAPLFGLIGGVLADRLDRRLLQRCKTYRAPAGKLAWISLVSPVDQRISTRSTFSKSPSPKYATGAS